MVSGYIEHMQEDIYDALNNTGCSADELKLAFKLVSKLAEHADDLDFENTKLKLQR